MRPADPLSGRPVLSGIQLGIVQAAARRHGRHDALLRHAGLEGRRDRLADERQWWSWSEKAALYDALPVVLDSPTAIWDAGKSALETTTGRTLRAATRALGTPAAVYGQIARVNHKVSRYTWMDCTGSAPGRVTVRMGLTEPVPARRHDCQLVGGMFAAVPTLFGLPPARVTETSCMADGAETCTWDVVFATAVRGRRRTLAATAVLGAGAAAATGMRRTDLAVGLAGASAVGVAGHSALRVAGLRREVVALRSRVDEHAHVASALRALLGALAGELRRDELLERIVELADRELQGDAVALLLPGADGTLEAHSTGQRHHTLVEGVRAWLEGSHARLTAPALLDDLGAHPAFAATVGQIGSLCAAPLLAHGRNLGLLVTAARSAHTFLDQDLDWLAAYAHHAAIALTNAELYAEQEAMARLDPLTRLANRRGWHEAVTRYEARYRRDGRPFAIALVDLDGFKGVNDNWGHAAGDDLLRGIAGAMRAATRAEEVVARIGGDEFAILTGASTLELAELAVRRASGAADAYDDRVGASWGIAHCPGDGTEEAVLHAVADGRLYEMKSARR